MKKLVLAFMVASLFASCTSTINKKVDLRTSKEDIENIRKDYSKEYTPADIDAMGDEIAKGLFARALLGEKLDKNSKIGIDKTYKELLDGAKAKRLAFESKQAEYDAAIAEINKKISVDVLSKEIQSDAYDIQHQLEITFKLKNLGQKDISGVTGGVSAYDMFDKRIAGFQVECIDGIKSNSEVVVKRYFLTDYDNETKDVANIPMDKLRFVWAPEKIVYSDGTTESAPIAPTK